MICKLLGAERRCWRSHFSRTALQGRTMNVELAYTDKEITAWGGMGLTKRMLDCIGFETALKNCGLPEPLRNQGYRSEQFVFGRMALT
jgi:hypothetical protein